MGWEAGDNIIVIIKTTESNFPHPLFLSTLHPRFPIQRVIRGAPACNPSQPRCPSLEPLSSLLWFPSCPTPTPGLTPRPIPCNSKPLSRAQFQPHIPHLGDSFFAWLHPNLQCPRLASGSPYPPEPVAASTALAGPQCGLGSPRCLTAHLPDTPQNCHCPPAVKM